MKITKYLLLTIVLFFNTNCASAPEPTENPNTTWQNSSEIQTPQMSPAVAPSGENQAQQTNAPDALIRDLYKMHDKQPGAIVQGKNRAILDKYFDRNLADLIWKDMTANQNEIGTIDFDIFYNTQDPDIKKLSVGAPQISGERASVPVTFENYGTKNSLTYSLVKQKGTWKISDINYGAGNTLLKYFKESNANVKNAESASGEFGGTYRVGDTTCTVKPVKMAFEVKWEKGAGAEIYFSADGSRPITDFAFTTDPKNGKANVFNFDDGNFDTGTFYRADGKELPIKRIR